MVYDDGKRDERFATVPALPVAIQIDNGGAGGEVVSTAVGNVAPARYEYGHRDHSEQERKRCAFCAPL